MIGSSDQVSQLWAAVAAQQQAAQQQLGAAQQQLGAATALQQLGIFAAQQQQQFGAAPIAQPQQHLGGAPIVQLQQQIGGVTIVQQQSQLSAWPAAPQWPCVGPQVGQFVTQSVPAAQVASEAVCPQLANSLPLTGEPQIPIALQHPAGAEESAPLAAARPWRARSRSPKRVDSTSATGPQPERTIIVDFPSSKLGQLVGFKGLTIQKVKDTAGVFVLHIDDREKAKARSQPTVPVEMSGSEEQVMHCQRILQSICCGDQTEVGHLTALINIEPAAVGKIMGNKGSTVKQLSEETVCYIEIQQDRNKGKGDTPRLLISGMPHQVEYAVQLVNRFIASPGSKLDFVLRPDLFSQAGSLAASSVRAKLASALQPMLAALTGSAPVQSSLINASFGGAPVALSAFEPDGPKEERIIEIPARKKSHLVGLRGQTIELVQRTTGVLKCHIMVERDKYEYDKDGQIPLQICGTRDRVETCISVVERIIAGDYSGIGHTCHVMPIEQTRVNYLRGDRWQVINYLKDLTGCYMDVIQGPPYGLARGEAQLFMTGPVERVARARAIIDTMLANMDKLDMPDINVDAPWRRDEEAAKRKAEEEDKTRKVSRKWRRSSPSP